MPFTLLRSGATYMQTVDALELYESDFNSITLDILFRQDDFLCGRQVRSVGEVKSRLVDE